MNETKILDPSEDPARGSPGVGHRLVWGFLVPLVFLVGLMWFAWSERETLLQIGNAPSADLLLIAVLLVVSHFLNSLEFWLLYSATGARLRVMENWMLFTAGQISNHLPGRIGTIYRLRYMRSVHGVPYLHSAAVHGANLVITVGAAALVGAAGVASATVFHDHSLSIPLLVLFAAMASGAGVLALVRLPPLRLLSGRAARVWLRFNEGWEAVRKLPRTALLVVLLEIVKYGLTAWRIQVTFSLIGIEAPYSVFLVLAPAAGIASFIGITPGALGFREAFVTGAAAAMGMELTDGLLGATVDRAVMLATFLVLGGIGLAVTYPRLRASSKSESVRNRKAGAEGE